MGDVRFSAVAVVDDDGWCHGWLVVIMKMKCGVIDGRFNLKMKLWQ